MVKHSAEVLASSFLFARVDLTEWINGEWKNESMHEWMNELVNQGVSRLMDEYIEHSMSRMCGWWLAVNVTYISGEGIDWTSAIYFLYIWHKAPSISRKRPRQAAKISLLTIVGRCVFSYRPRIYNAVNGTRYRVVGWNSISGETFGRPTSSSTFNVPLQ